MKNIARIVLIVCLSLIVPYMAMAQSKISVEAVSPDITLTVRGPEKGIDAVNPAKIKGMDNCIILLSSEYGATTGIKSKQATAIVVDDKMAVTKVVNPATVNMAIPAKGFVLLALGGDAKQEHRKFLAESFREGDVIKLRKDGNIATLNDILAMTKEQIQLATDKIITVTHSDLKIEGMIANYSPSKKYFVSVGGKEKQAVGKDFSFTYNLSKGVNYVDLELWQNDKKINQQTVIAFLKTNETEAKRKVLWVEQFPNAKVLTNSMVVDEMLAKAKEAGFNCVALDVKGPEGFASYRKNPLSKTPYYTATINPNKKVADDGFDLLQALIDGAKKHGLRVYTSFNFFTEGNLTTQDFAILKQHPEWEEIVQRPEDKGALLKVSESQHGLDAKAGKRVALAFVNPSNKEVCDFQLLRVQEVLENYAIDGIVLDRTRYDNLYADFSDVTRNAFEKYLEAKGKTLTAFPQDAFVINKEGKLVEGKHYIDWLTFRSTEIANFAKRVRQTVDAYNSKSSRKVEMAAYVGSWYELYYQNGVNWASRNFKYDSRLSFPESRIYSDEYSKASYTDQLDFLMIGTYYKTPQEIAKYATLGNILTNGELPLIASISLPDLKEEYRAGIFESAVEKSSGVMVFDLCYIDNWVLFIEQMKNIKNK